MPSLNAVFKLNDGYSRVINLIDRSTRNAERSIIGASRSTDKFNQSLDKTESAANKAMSGLKRLGAAAGGLFALKKATSITDEYTNTVARLSMVNDGLQTQKELQDNIYLAAQRSRGAYNSMAQSVAKLGMMAGDAFSSTQEIVDFTEMINKSFKVGGASKVEQQAGMLQLTQAMASGRLQGDEFRSISENAPMITKALSQYLDVPIGKLKEMGAEGLLTSDIIKNAMFSMADEINGQFEKIPMTFSDVGTQIQNHALYTFQGVMQKLNDTLNSDAVMAFVNMFKGGIDIVAQAVFMLVTLIGNLTSTIVSNWDIIQPILIAMAIVLLPMIIAQLWAMLPPLLIAAGTWLMMNAPILMVIGLVALFIYMMIQSGVTVGEIVGYITGTFWALGAVIYNVFAVAYNIIASFVNFLGNIFVNPIMAIKKLFYEMALYLNQIFLGIAKQIENLLNAIPFVEVNITSSLQNSVDWLKGEIANIDSEAGFKDFVPKMDLKDVNKSFNNGFAWGNNAVNSLSNGGYTPSQFGGMAVNGIGDYMSNGALPVTNGKGSGGSLNVSIDKEDIKYLKDIAERDYVNKYTSATLAPNVTVQFGDVHENADANKVAGIIEKILREEIAVVGEG